MHTRPMLLQLHIGVRVARGAQQGRRSELTLTSSKFARRAREQQAVRASAVQQRSPGVGHTPRVQISTRRGRRAALSDARPQHLRKCLAQAASSHAAGRNGLLRRRAMRRRRVEHTTTQTASPCGRELELHLRPELAGRISRVVAPLEDGSLCVHRAHTRASRPACATAITCDCHHARAHAISLRGGATVALLFMSSFPTGLAARGQHAARGGTVSWN